MQCARSFGLKRMDGRITFAQFVEHLSVSVFASFLFVFEGGMFVLIVLVPDHCLSFYFRLPDQMRLHMKSGCNRSSCFRGDALIS